ncbi:DUF202 domain-containing protein [Flavobacterium sp. N3904]|uniref:DUF202 domain-containing protein n=1 Tax=Flavobacterium sp. N3904 TaxID=2986835 RepID=UPI00222404C5|nr:DUF202 domain-containing protein [Flavobacterium sp. N3904]
MKDEITSNPEAIETEKKLLKEKKDRDKELITLERFRIAAEKMQLSWIARSITISALGFTVYRLLEDEEAKGIANSVGSISPSEVGLIMLLIGFVGLVWATIEHTKTLEKVKRQYTVYQKMPVSISLIQSYAIILVTLILAISSCLRYFKI